MIHNELNEAIREAQQVHSHIFSVILLASALAVPASGTRQQGARPRKPELSCTSFRGEDLTWKKKELWDGYEISFGPAPHSERDSEANCMAVIYDRSGKEVYRATDINVTLDPATGMDIDGDGAPDVVVTKGSSGGSGGSWDIEAISLKPQPHILFTYNQNFPPADFRTDSQGKVVLWSGWGGNSDLGYSMAHANDPSARMVYRFADGQLKDVTPEFCSEIENDKHFLRPSALSLDHFKNSKIDSGKFQTLDDERTAGKVMSLVIHYVFCRQFERALGVIHQMWPEQDRANLIQNLKREISEPGACPECAKEIEQWR